MAIEAQEVGAGDQPTDARDRSAEAIRLQLANAWGELGSAWGITPAVARVHGYLMARGAPLPERGSARPSA